MTELSQPAAISFYSHLYLHFLLPVNSLNVKGKFYNLINIDQQIERKITGINKRSTMKKKYQLRPARRMNALLIRIGVEIVWILGRVSGTPPSPADFAEADDIITNLAKKRGIEIIERTP